MDFISWLGEQMKQKGMNQSQLARRLKVNPSTVSNWMRGMSMPDVDSLTALSGVFDYDHLALMEIVGVLSQRDPALPTGDEQMLINTLKTLRGTPVYKPTLHTLQTIADLASTLLDPPSDEKGEES